MVDLHTHILPGIDDGAKSVNESIRMLTDAYKQGVRLCVATPHAVLHRRDSLAHFLEHRRDSAVKLHTAVQSGNITVPEILFGAEVYLDHDIAHADLEKLRIGNTPYILLEFPTDKYNPYWSDWLHSMTLRGFRPIIAHIDRYLHIDKMISDFAGLSVTYQINASRMFSFSGRRVIQKLLHGNEPCIFASDMHNTTLRTCNMKSAFLKAKKKFPKEAENLFSRRAGQMLQKNSGGEYK